MAGRGHGNDRDIWDRGPVNDNDRPLTSRMRGYWCQRTRNEEPCRIWERSYHS
jgi:hypothetical protein